MSSYEGVSENHDFQSNPLSQVKERGILVSIGDSI